jgi:hypothetical protein
MKTLFTLLLFGLLMIISVNARAMQAQDTIRKTDEKVENIQQSEIIHERVYDPHLNKIIPDKVFEFGVPLLILFLIANTILGVFRIREESRLKEKALEKGISEPTLIELFRDDKKMVRYVYLKWTLVLAALGAALLYVHFLHEFLNMSSGYLALGFIALFLSGAFFIYYRIIRKD